ncbi:MAG: methyltransferase [Proteobacteria bacterium]|nr:methyltransferase [Pseudomonadota bacterium]MBU1389416.1 methyltransferase [Pseudomonadota bacterium]MBU1541236.1 methyltransferase [Pseudomonadota bacterium]MBU2430077.1 methyltransferase [Pseudomonadota bacterium]MBU2481048.1 methyltransferase [Pseudomonadota bacterium]
MNILQPENGYRFSMDSFILAAHVHAENKKTLLDIGTGCGIITLMLARRYPDLDIIGIEIQKELSGFACRNILNNGFENHIHIINKNINALQLNALAEPADIIVSNPPYKKKQTGRLNPDSQKAIARHEIHLDINQIFECSQRLLKEKGLLYLIFPADRIKDLQTAMIQHRFCTKFMRFVYTRKGLPPKRLVLCAAKNDHPPCTVIPPLYVYSDKNQYSNEYLTMMKPYESHFHAAG